ncbi:uncharacterized protein LOC131858621 [Cryptomeria japonica]|uniref:uncharacterized protein LOC131858621 n=1 Tax=Cryptomeria japonica TaxID=3369 RepID=UPI0027DA7F59|nr:uncharacterized protein LOC131858621 [Cryptomeria japonica]
MNVADVSVCVAGGGGRRGAASGGGSSQVVGAGRSERRTRTGGTRSSAGAGWSEDAGALSSAERRVSPGTETGGGAGGAGEAPESGARAEDLQGAGRGVVSEKGYTRRVRTLKSAKNGTVCAVSESADLRRQGEKSIMNSDIDSNYPSRKGSDVTFQSIITDRVYGLYKKN